MDANEIETLFEQINDGRAEIARIAEPFLEQIAALNNEMNTAIAPHAEIVDALKEDIKTSVMMGEMSVKTTAGTCSYVNGRKPPIKWDDAALNGYAVANPDILQFRSKGMPGKPSVRFNMKEI